MESIVSTMEILVNIQWDADKRRYIWNFSGAGVDPVTGNFVLPTHERTAITFQLDVESANTYQLLYVNMDPDVCATHEIEQVTVHRHKNAITVIDRNSNNHTKRTPFCLKLAARVTDNIHSGFLSPDPQVTNNPN